MKMSQWWVHAESTEIPVWRLSTQTKDIGLCVSKIVLGSAVARTHFTFYPLSLRCCLKEAWPKNLTSNLQKRQLNISSKAKLVQNKGKLTKLRFKLTFISWNWPYLSRNDAARVHIKYLSRAMPSPSSFTQCLKGLYPFDWSVALCVIYSCCESP